MFVGQKTAPNFSLEENINGRKNERLENKNNKNVTCGVHTPDFCIKSPLLLPPILS